MIIKKISTLNTRKIDHCNIPFSEKTNIIIGPNGTGKTTVLEAIYFLLTTKSFRKKANQNIIQNNEKELQIKAEVLNKEKQTLKLTYNGKQKQFEINQKKIKKTSEILLNSSIVIISPEEPNPIEGYRQARLQYFDKIIFKTDPTHIKTIKKYNKLLEYKNEALRKNQNQNIWDQQIAEEGIKTWGTRKDFYKKFCRKIEKTQEKIIEEKHYIIKYTNTQKTTTEEYKKQLINNIKNNKVNFGPHKDIIRYYKKGSSLKEQGSQGEKKLFIYILKLTEAEYLYEKKKNKPILLFDDFVAKLDGENIMKIFTYFHCKFQTIITTTKKDGLSLIKSQKNNSGEHIKIINLNDKIKQIHQ